MDMQIKDTKIILKHGDITKEDTDAIVNAANRSLRGGGGVDGAIHSAGGPAIMEECVKIGRCETGEAVVTTGGNLKAQYVIHTVGPIWSGDSKEEARLLGSCYRNSLRRAVEKSLHSVAFPSISTGAYGYPVRLAAPVALQTIIDFLRDEQGSLKEVRMVLYDRVTLEAYEKALQDIMQKQQA